MQVTETLNDGLRRGYTITVTAAELEAKVDEKIREAAPEVEMKGFRKGKVPFALLKRQFGPRILGEAMQESVDSAMREHFEATGDRPALQPEVKMTNENWQEGQDVVVSLAYEALPEVPEVDLGSIALERMVVKPDDAAIDEALGKLAESAQSFEDRPEGEAAQSGDQVTFDFVGKVDREAFEGGSAEDYPLVLGSGSFIPGFEEQLEGVKAGEEKTVTVTFPEEYGAAHLAGKEATFDCTIKAVKAPAATPIDDELAKRFGAEDLAALKGQITEKLEAEFAQAARLVVKRKLLDALDGMVSFELPPSMIDAEAGQIAHQLWHEDNPEVQGHDHPEIEPTEEHRKLAERRVRLGLLLADIGKRAAVEVTDQEFTQAVVAQARQYPGHERAFFDFVRGNQQVQQQIRAPLFEEKVVDHVLAQAKVTETEVDRDTLKAAVDALDDDATAAAEA
ncbi:MAG: trigger factor [Alkalilacustris sp.]